MKKKTAFILKGNANPLLFLEARDVEEWFKKNIKKIDGEHLPGGSMGPMLHRTDRERPLLTYPIGVAQIAEEISRPSFHGLYFGLLDTCLTAVSITRIQVYKPV